MEMVLPASIRQLFKRQAALLLALCLPLHLRTHTKKKKKKKGRGRKEKKGATSSQAVKCHLSPDGSCDTDRLQPEPKAHGSSAPCPSSRAALCPALQSHPDRPKVSTTQSDAAPRCPSCRNVPRAAPDFRLQPSCSRAAFLSDPPVSSSKTKEQNSRLPASPTQPNCFIASREGALLTPRPSWAGGPGKKRALYGNEPAACLLQPAWAARLPQHTAPQTLPQSTGCSSMHPWSTDVCR